MISKLLTRTSAAATALIGLHAYQNQADLTLKQKIAFFASEDQNGLLAASARNAICLMYPNNNSGVVGIVSFQQESITSSTKVVAHLKGLQPNSINGLLVHTQGDLTEGIKSLGEPYNQFGGAQQQEGQNEGFYRFTGDLGNLKTNEMGEGYLAISHPYIRLFGEGNVYGRSCVAYEEGNNSQTGLNESKRLAAGVIGHTDEFKNFGPLKSASD